MKTSSTGGGASEEPSKSSQSKVSKKSTKSRSKSTKVDASIKNALAGASIGFTSLPATPTHVVNIATTPTTPTTSLGNYNLFDASFVVAANNVEPASNSSRVSQSHHKSYAGFDPRSIKVFWEQHDQTDVELSQDVCARLAEDASYKVWELVNNVKIASRHSGGVVTYDLVNEVLKDSDVPPMLGAMDSDCDRIEYDNSYYFHSDRIFELRDEFQTDVHLSMPLDEDFQCFCPIEDKNTDQMKQIVQGLITAALFGDAKARSSAISYAFETPLMGSCFRVIVGKMLQLLAFRQHDNMSQRCWRLLRACNYNATANPSGCRPEYFNLAEVLISQLMAPYETIKVLDCRQAHVETAGTTSTSIKVEMDDELKMEPPSNNEPQSENFTNQPMDIDAQQQSQPLPGGQSDMNFSNEQTIYKLQVNDGEVNDAEEQEQEPQQLSAYFASPVGIACVDELCETIGQLASQSGYLQSECLFLIKRRLTRFFEGRNVCSERDYQYLSRAVRGLLALGEYAFREFIPFIYKLNVNDIPESLWLDLLPSAIFLGGRDDIYLYEWLEFGCGADKLQPFLVHFARAYLDMLTEHYQKAKAPAYRIEARPGVRRLEWSTLAAAMCHGDDPSKALKPKPTLSEAFPELVQPNLQLNCAGTIRFKFAGCRPVLLKPKGVAATQFMDSPSTNGGSDIVHSDILISKRKFFKPLTNVRRVLPLAGYHFLRI